MSDVETLRRAIEAMCTPVCKVRAIRLIPDQRGMAYLCFVEPDSPDLSWSLIEEIGGIDYGNSVAFRIPFDRL